VKRPRIAVSGVVRNWEGGERTGVNTAYIRALVATGAVPITVSPLLGIDLAEQALEPFDGLVLTGGEDVHPSHYRAEPGPRLGTIDQLRDRFELALFHQARRRRLPVLGICRGLQLINVAMGGTLWQDLPTERPGSIDHAPATARGERVHPVRLAAGSRAAHALGTTQILANSIHHQAIRELAPDLVATAWSEDGVIEAVETEGEAQWVVAVQWHPEELHEHVEAPDRGLFAALCDAAYAWRDGQAERPSSRVRRSGP
jgi:putative glutamine amidotransferase